MEPDTGDRVEIISGILSRKQIVDVCSSMFLFGPKNSEKVQPSGNDR